MKKNLFTYLFCLLACTCMTLASCDKPEPIVPGPGEEEQEGEGGQGGQDTVATYSILGHWNLDYSTQQAGDNFFDNTAFYGNNFQLTFEEDGTLIVADAYNTTDMQWTLDGDQLAFIQAPGADPVMYTVKKLTADSLDIENGTGTDYITTMHFLRD